MLGGGYECRFRLPDGTPEEAVIFLEEASTLAQSSEASASTAQPADAEKIRLLVESARIRLAYAHDRQFAVSMSGIQTLSRRIEAF